MRKTYDLDGSSASSVPFTRDVGHSTYLELARATEPAHARYADVQAIPTLLVEPNTLLREGLRRILAETPYNPVSLAASFDEALAGWEAANHPFLMIMDGVRAHDEACHQIQRLKADSPSARVLILVDRYDLKQIIAAFQAGADAYLVKSVSCEVLVKTLDLVMLGEVVFPSIVLELLREHALHVDPEVETQAMEKPADGHFQSKGLSVRETVILRCLMEGDSNKLIARKFDITEATVKVHVKAILRKIHAKNRTQAAIWAASHLPAEGQLSA
ncbi:LuxR C-terminal-related transcriptional regulator [Microvirga solisilvae]|uniref:LuxR C-terminal-related transcriptional regulator n=1 Tax=Microvirga solisilvae TaxID=2919498 RepID=UPI001FAF775D|nr:response regulator transcription factor [Microvirga solisilvae]